MPVPVPPTSLIGRDLEVATIEARLREGVRLISLVGPPGVGKTRLAQHIAWNRLGTGGRDVVYVPLETIRDAGLVPATIARELDVREAGGRPLLEALVAYVRDRPVLLVLDNFEHVREAASIVAQLIAAGTALQVLVSSRTPLHVRAEVLLSIEPLALPLDSRLRNVRPKVGAPVDAEYLSRAAAAPAVRLFLERARAVRPSWELTEATAADTVAICTRLDGLPLAIELAAARAKLFSVREIAERLSDRFSLLRAGPSDAPARHQTLRAAIGWSYDMLAPAEQRLFRVLSVFTAGATFDAVAAVFHGTDNGIAPAPQGRAAAAEDVDLPELVGSLIDHSLLRRAEDRDATSRFVMLESIREFAAEQLDLAGEAASAWLHFAAWFVTFAELAGEALVGSDPAVWLVKLQAEHDNIRAVLDWSSNSGHAELGLELMAALWRFWHVRGYLAEGRAWIDRLLERAPHAPARVRGAVLLGAANLAFDQGDYRGAREYGELSLTIYRETDRPEVADALMWLGAVAYRLSSYDDAQTYLEESLALAQSAADRRTLARVQNLLGLIAMDEGQFADARARLTESLDNATYVGDLRMCAVMLNNLGLCAHREDAFDESRDYLERALAIGRQLGNVLEMGRSLVTLAMVARALDDPRAALPFAEEARALAKETANNSMLALALNQLTPIARALGDLEAARDYSVSHLQLARDMQYPIEIVAAVTDEALNAQAEAKPRRAVRLLAAGDAIREQIGLAQHPGMTRMLEAHMAELRGVLGEAAFADAWSRGTAMSRSTAIEDALHFGADERAEATAAVTPQSGFSTVTPAGPPVARNARPAQLTDRQLEILRLLAAGRSNREIANLLVVSERTVEHHTRTIYHKIAVAGRVEATAYAHRMGLADA